MPFSLEPVPRVYGRKYSKKKIAGLVCRLSKVRKECKKRGSGLNGISYWRAMKYGAVRIRAEKKILSLIPYYLLREQLTRERMYYDKVYASYRRQAVSRAFLELIRMRYLQKLNVYNTIVRNKEEVKWNAKLRCAK